MLFLMMAAVSFTLAGRDAAAAASRQCPAPGRAGRCDELHAGDTAANAAMLCELRSAARPVELRP